MVTSYYSLIKFIEEFASNHMQIYRFEAEFIDQLPKFATDGEAFPVLFMAPITTEFGDNVDKYTIDFYCYAPIKKDRTDSMKVYSDTQLVLNDLKKYIKDGIDTRFGIDDDDTTSSLPMREITMDYVTGNIMTLTIEVETYSICDIPFSKLPESPSGGCVVTYNTFLTCETLADCSTFKTAIEGIEDKLNTSTWTVDLMDGLSITFYAPYDFQITDVTNIFGAPAMDIIVDGFQYVIGDLISIGSEIIIKSPTNGVANLTVIKLL